MRSLQYGWLPVVLDATGRAEINLTATAVRYWLMHLAVKTLFIVPRSPWQNGSLEPVNERL